MEKNIKNISISRYSTEVMNFQKAMDNFKDFRNAYVKAKEEMADGYNGEMIKLFDDENFYREHLVPYMISHEDCGFHFYISDFHWFNDFESDVEWEEGEKFDGNKLVDALSDEIDEDFECEWDDEDFTVKFS